MENKTKVPYKLISKKLIQWPALFCRKEEMKMKLSCEQPLQMVSKEACYKGPPFKTRFHELDGCQASGKAKNDARRSVAIASLSSLFWYDKEYILEFIFRWKTTQGLVKNVIKSSILFVTKEWRGAVYFLFYVEQTRQACLYPQKQFNFCQSDSGTLFLTSLVISLVTPSATIT